MFANANTEHINAASAEASVRLACHFLVHECEGAGTFVQMQRQLCNCYRGGSVQGWCRLVLLSFARVLHQTTDLAA